MKPTVTQSTYRVFMDDPRVRLAASFQLKRSRLYTLLMILSSTLSANTSMAKQRELQTQCQLGAMTAVEVLDSYSVGSGFLKGLGGKSCSYCAIDRRIRTRH